MLYKSSWINIADGTNALWLQLFHLYKGFFRKVTYVGYYVKGSVKEVTPPKLEYKGFKKKNNKKGDIARALLIRTRYWRTRKDGMSLSFATNSGVLLKKKTEFRSKYIYGASTTLLRRKRLLTTFTVLF